jgi:hypothetical protein
MRDECGEEGVTINDSSMNESVALGMAMAGTSFMDMLSQACVW